MDLERRLLDQAAPGCRALRADRCGHGLGWRHTAAAALRRQHQALFRRGLPGRYLDLERRHLEATAPGRLAAGDQARYRLILFGGYDGAYLGDTWAWNGSTWTQLNPAAAPSARDTDSLAYDAASQRSILFGGFNDDAGRLGDTWAWNGSTWTQLNPATSPGVVSTAWQAAYDRASRQLVVFGGDPGLGTYSNDTWTWDGSTWIQQSPANSPAPRAYGSMTYDRALHRVVLFAGVTIGSFPRTTWEWDGSTWRRR